MYVRGELPKWAVSLVLACKFGKYGAAIYHLFLGRLACDVNTGWVFAPSPRVMQPHNHYARCNEGVIGDTAPWSPRRVDTAGMARWL